MGKHATSERVSRKWVNLGLSCTHAQISFCFEISIRDTHIQAWLVHASRRVSPFLNADQKVVAFHDERCIFKYLLGFSHLRFPNNPIYHPTTGFISRFKNANSPTLRSVRPRI